MKMDLKQTVSIKYKLSLCIAMTLILAACGMQHNPMSSYPRLKNDMPTPQWRAEKAQIPAQPKLPHVVPNPIQIVAENPLMTFTPGKLGIYNIDIVTSSNKYPYRLISSNLPKGARLEKPTSSDSQIWQLTWMPPLASSKSIPNKTTRIVHISVQIRDKDKHGKTRYEIETGPSSTRALRIAIDSTLHTPTISNVSDWSAVGKGKNTSMVMRMTIDDPDTIGRPSAKPPALSFPQGPWPSEQEASGFVQIQSIVPVPHHPGEWQAEILLNTKAAKSANRSAGKLYFLLRATSFNRIYTQRVISLPPLGK